MWARIEDKIAVSEFIEVLFLEDKAKFTAKFTRYEDPFADDFHTLLLGCKAIVSTGFYITQIKNVTELMQVTAISIRGDLNDIEMMAINAGDALNMKWEDMGFKQMRLSISSKNMEGLTPAWNVLNANIAANDAALTDEGLTPAIVAALKAKVDAVNALNVKQFDMMQQKADTVAVNHEKFDDLWQLATNISRAGKVIFKYDNPTRAKAYIINHMLKQIRHDLLGESALQEKLAELLAANKGELQLTVKDFGIADSWIEDAMVTISGVTEVIPTDEEGKQVRDLTEGTYNVTVSKTGYVTGQTTVVIKAGKITEIVMELKPMEV